jgi:ArsR family transcriptional regulator, arsenate/arsenite/antimonite-responsive transcriptional repressor
MPSFDTDLVLTAPKGAYSFAIEPALNALYSISILNRVDQLSGLGEWVQQTAARMGPEGLHRNNLVMIGLHYAVIPERSFPNFWAYLDYLATVDPALLVGQLTRRLWSTRTLDRSPAGALPPPERPADMLRSLDAYLSFLLDYSSCVEVDVEIESEAYGYMVDPPRLQRLIVDHLRGIWDGGLRAEWEQQRGLLQESVDAFRRLDLGGLRPKDAIERVVGRELDEKWGWILERSREITFVPSPHIGPYMGKLEGGDRLAVFFGARLPTDLRAGTSALSRSDLLVRLGALTDDTRLRILALLVERPELCAPDIMATLDLSQSAVSRHLRQLHAAGYVRERWHDGSKCYRLDRARIGDTLAALQQFFAE